MPLAGVSRLIVRSAGFSFHRAFAVRPARESDRLTLGIRSTVQLHNYRRPGVTGTSHFGSSVFSNARSHSDHSPTGLTRLAATQPCGANSTWPVGVFWAGVFARLGVLAVVFFAAVFRAPGVAVVAFCAGVFVRPAALAVVVLAAGFRAPGVAVVAFCAGVF